MVATSDWMAGALRSLRPASSRIDQSRPRSRRPCSKDTIPTQRLAGTDAETGLSDATELVTQSWSIRGGQACLGRLLPAAVVLIGLITLAGAIEFPLRQNDQEGLAPSLILGAFALAMAYLYHCLINTVWSISKTSTDRFLCRSTRKSRSILGRDIVAVTGDAYGLFLVLFISQGKIRMWASLRGRDQLLTAIRECNPSFEVDRYARF
jgi:hypothetical protein